MIETGYAPGSDFDKAAQVGLPQEDMGKEQTAGKPEDAELLKLADAANRQAVSFAQQNWQAARDASYRSFRSEYTDNSKYKSDDFKNRSKIFRPKTKIAVTKDLAATAQTLFATVDNVSITAGDESDEAQVANAELIGALLNYRLDRTSGNNAIPWFLTALGARQDCQIAGVCVSKQYWDYKCREKQTTQLLKDAVTGEVTETTVMKKVKLKDKPEIDLIPPENVGMDPAAHWTDPVNSGAYFNARYPMHRQDVMDMMTNPGKPWRQIEPDKMEGVFNGAKVKDFETAQTRRAREGGTDRMDNQTSTVREFDVVWVYEWFIRTKDEDWCFWTLGMSHLLTDPEPTEAAYPWNGGQRPYRVGYGNLEAHRIVPQSPVETWRPLQQEINDVTNLRLDTMKQVIQPVALVKRGMKIDTDGLKRRYPILFVNNPETDVKWDRPPDSAASAFAETSRLDTDMDDLAGTFNGGSVANNRQVGETVGGMRMMSGAANAVSEFYIRLFVETWVEPVLADLAKLEAYYESDEKIMKLAAKRAPSMVHYGMDSITDEFLQQEVLVRVSAGTGSPDPSMKLQKLGSALKMMESIFGASKKFQSGALVMKEEALINEIFGDAGLRDGFDRFFEEGQPMAPHQDPGLTPAELQNNQAERTHKEGIAKLNAKTKITTALIGHKAADRSQQAQHQQDREHGFVQSMLEIAHGKSDDAHRHMDRQAAAEQFKEAAKQKAKAAP